MKKSLFFISSAFLLAALTSSCSDENKDQLAMFEDDAFINLSLNISTGDIKTKAMIDATDDGTDAEGICWNEDLKNLESTFDASQYEAKITIRYHVNANDQDKGSDIIFVPIKNIVLEDGSQPVAVTDQFSLLKPLKDTRHVVDGIYIITKKQAGDGEDFVPKVVFSSVVSGANYANHIRKDHQMPISLFVGDTDSYENVDDINYVVINDKVKTPIPVSVLCAVNEEAPNFGYSLWSFNFVRVVCIPYSVNVKTNPCDEYSKDIYGITDLTISRISKTGLLEEGKEFSYEIFHHSSTTEDEVVGKICFNYQSDEAIDDQIYDLSLTIKFKNGRTATIFGQIPLENLWNYKNSGYWVVPKGSDINSTDGYIHFDLFNIDITKSGIINSEFKEEDGKWILKIIEPYLCESDFSCNESKIKFPTNLPNGVDNYVETNSPLTECDWIFVRFTQGIKSPTLYSFDGALYSPIIYLNKGDIATYAIKTAVNFGEGIEKDYCLNKYYEVELIPIDVNSYNTMTQFTKQTKNLENKEVCLCAHELLSTTISSSAAPESNYYRVKFNIKTKNPDEYATIVTDFSYTGFEEKKDL